MLLSGVEMPVATPGSGSLQGGWDIEGTPSIGNHIQPTLRTLQTTNCTNSTNY